MATLMKFNFLSQCGVTQSSTISPRTSPIVNLPRRKTTLRMLLCRSSEDHRDEKLRTVDRPVEKKRDTLKDLFVSSPTAFEEECDGNGAVTVKGEAVIGMRVTESGIEPLGSPRSGWTGFRFRAMIKRTWRPVLFTIPENEESY